MKQQNLIKQHRISRGIQQKTMAAELGVLQPIISRWENNVNQPDPDNLQRVAEYFGCTTDELVIQSDEQPINLSGNTGLTANKIEGRQNIRIVLPSNNQDNLSELEQFLIEKFRQLPIDDKLDVIQFVKNKIQ